MDSDVLNRFLRYVQINTTSKKDVKQIPSTSCQFDLANILVEELKELGISDASVNENCIVMATVPSNLPNNIIKKIPTICFIAHIDTTPSEPGKNVKPQVIFYKDGDIQFPNNQNLKIKAEEIPELPKEENRIVISEGNTLLGADDKAGIAEIMTVIDLLQFQQKPHGIIKILFTPDEEVGKGIDAVDVKKIDADFAYTIDGGRMGELEIECFNAADGSIKIEGYNVHTGSAYKKMINSIRILKEVIKLFPDEEAPETTRGREGFYHPRNVEGDVNSTIIKFILRDFDLTKLEKRIQKIKEGIDDIQLKYKNSKISVNIQKMYFNMKKVLDNYPEVIKIAEDAIKQAGIQIIHKSIRGGTDGAKLSYMGLPTPNIFTGCINLHSKKEFIPVFSMKKAIETILNIIDITVEKASKKAKN